MPEDLDARVRDLEMKDAADRERLLGLLERAERELFPLVEMYGRLDERFNQVLRDVGNAHKAIRELEEMLEIEREERRRGQAERKQELEDAIEERKREMARTEITRESQHRELRVKYLQIMAGVISIFLTSLAGVVVAWISARGGVK